jgi:hypothetical protein
MTEAAAKAATEPAKRNFLAIETVEKLVIAYNRALQTCSPASHEDHVASTASPFTPYHHASSARRHESFLPMSPSRLRQTQTSGRAVKLTSSLRKKWRVQFV